MKLTSLKNIIIQQVPKILNRYKSPKSVFSEIYKSKAWAGTIKPGQNITFCSGAGSSSKELVEHYIKDLKLYFDALSLQRLTLVDLGCGDFQVGSKLSQISDNYIGVDVVPELIDYNRLKFSSDKVSFRLLNIITDDLPDADVCIIRQVFQHLSNAQIKKALFNVAKYKYIIITEHLPEANEITTKNRDKVQGPDIRYNKGSGVFLDAEPFSLPSDLLHEVSNIQLTHPNTGKRWGRLFTQAYVPNC